jgi:hypothetical protein
MKISLLAILLLLCFTAAAQDWKNPLPIDSASQKITYEGVVQVPGATQLELYSRALNWFNTYFGPEVARLEVADISGGRLAANGYAPFDYIPFGKVMTWAMWRTIKIEVKEGRYRYTITNFRLGGALLTPHAVDSSVDEWLSPVIGKSKKPTRIYQSVFDGVERTTSAEMASLQDRMSMAAKKEKDW